MLSDLIGTQVEKVVKYITYLFPELTRTECLSSFTKEVRTRGPTQVPFLNLLRRSPYYPTLVTRIDNPWLLLATLPLYHPVQDLKMTPLLQFTPLHFLKSTPLPLLRPVCNFEALLGASLI